MQYVVAHVWKRRTDKQNRLILPEPDSSAFQSGARLELVSALRLLGRRLAEFAGSDGYRRFVRLVFAGSFGRNDCL